MVEEKQILLFTVCFINLLHTKDFFFQSMNFNGFVYGGAVNLLFSLFFVLLINLQSFFLAPDQMDTGVS